MGGLTPTPDSVNLHARFNIFGKKFDLGQFGIATAGLKDLFWNVYGPENRYYDFFTKMLTGEVASFDELPPFEDLFRPLTDLVSKLVGSVENINSKFSTEERTFVAEKFVEIYTKFFDYELLSVGYNANEMVQLYNEVKGYLPVIVSNLNSEYPVTFTKTIASPHTAKIILPTPAGIPVEFNVDTFAHMHFNGKFRLEGISGLSALLQLVSGGMPDFTLKSEMNTYSVSSVVMSMGSYIPYLSANAAVKIDTVHEFNTKADLVAMPTEKKIKLIVEPPQVHGSMENTDITIFKVKMTPMTVFKHYALRPTVAHEIYDIIRLNTVPNVHWQTPVLGLGIGLPMQIFTDYPSVLNLLKPHTFFVSPMWAEFKFIPTRGAADKFEFEIKYFGRDEEPKAAHAVTGLSFDGIEPAEGLAVDTARHIIFSARILHGPNEDTEKEIKMRIMHMYDENTYLKHQFNVQILSSPLKQDSTTPMKFVFDSVVFIPEFLTKFVEATPVHKEPELFSRAELK